MHYIGRFKFVLALFLALGLCFGSLAAQDEKDIEIAAGFSMTRAQPVDNVEKETQLGVSGSMTFFLNEDFGIAVDFGRVGATYGAPPNVAAISDFTFKQTSYMVGPQFRLLNNDKWTVAVRGVGGAVIGTAQIDLPFDAPDYLKQANSTEWGFAFGGNVDYYFHDRVGIRIIQPEVLITGFAGSQTNFRLTTGMVFRFGW
jgi:hypothetical protein